MGRQRSVSGRMAGGGELVRKSLGTAVLAFNSRPLLDSHNSDRFTGSSQARSNTTYALSFDQKVNKLSITPLWVF